MASCDCDKKRKTVRFWLRERGKLFALFSLPGVLILLPGRSLTGRGSCPSSPLQDAAWFLKGRLERDGVQSRLLGGNCGDHAVLRELRLELVLLVITALVLLPREHCLLWSRGVSDCTVISVLIVLTFSSVLGEVVSPGCGDSHAMVATVLLGRRDYVSWRGGGGAEHGRGRDHSDLRHPQGAQALLAQVTIVDLVATGRHPLVGVDGERVDSLVHCKEERLVWVFCSELVMQEHQQNWTKYNNILAGTVQK